MSDETVVLHAIMAETEAALEAERAAHDAERAAHDATRAELERVRQSFAASSLESALLRARLGEARDRAEAAERIAERPLPTPAAHEAPDLRFITEALARSERAIIAAMPKPIEYESITAMRDAAGLLREWRFVRKT